MDWMLKLPNGMATSMKTYLNQHRGCTLSIMVQELRDGIVLRPILLYFIVNPTVIGLCNKRQVESTDLTPRTKTYIFITYGQKAASTWL